MPVPRRVFVNGNILTMDAAGSIASSLVMEGERIVAVGSRDDISEYINNGAELVDLAGKTMMPGFYDAHGHFFMYAEARGFSEDLNSPPIGSCPDFAEMFRRLKARADRTPEGEWVLAYGFDDTMIAEKRFPTRRELDAVSTRHPICVNHISAHFVALNSLALERTGISAATPDPEGAVIRREEDGREPNGVLEESIIYQTVKPAIPDPGLDEMVAAYDDLSMFYAERGVTTAVDAATRPKDVKAVRKALEAGRMRVRLLYNPFYWVQEECDAIQCDSPMLTRGGVKFLQDGSIQGYTAYLSEPYHTPFNGNAGYRGYPIFEYRELAALIKKTHDQGGQCVIHTNGDAATDDAIKAIEEAQKANPRPEARHLLIHAQNAREDQLDKMAELGIMASFFSLHVYYWGDRHHNVFLGPERAGRLNPMASAIRRGIVCTAHCDSPVVPLTPFLSIATCVNRVSSTGRQYGPEQRIPVNEALRAHTINAAYQNGQEQDLGSLESGKLADMIVIDADPLSCDPADLQNIKVLETIIGGRTVYKA